MNKTLIELFKNAIAEVRQERIDLQIKEKTLIDALAILQEMEE
jgi:hypothetical protein